MSRKRPAAAHSHRSDDGHAFLGDPSDGDRVPSGRPDEPDAAYELAGELGTEFNIACTANEDLSEQTFEQISLTEVGGPFVGVAAREEVADDLDPNNPPGATVEPFPTPMRAGLLPSDPPLYKPEDR